jgi:hypothetical protein
VCVCVCVCVCVPFTLATVGVDQFVRVNQNDSIVAPDFGLAAFFSQSSLVNIFSQIARIGAGILQESRSTGVGALLRYPRLSECSSLVVHALRQTGFMGLPTPHSRVYSFRPLRDLNGEVCFLFNVSDPVAALARSRGYGYRVWIASSETAGDWTPFRWMNQAEDTTTIPGATALNFCTRSLKVFAITAEDIVNPSMCCVFGNPRELCD